MCAKMGSGLFDEYNQRRMEKLIEDILYRDMERARHAEDYLRGDYLNGFYYSPYFGEPDDDLRVLFNPVRIRKDLPIEKKIIAFRFADAVQHPIVIKPLIK